MIDAFNIRLNSTIEEAHKWQLQLSKKIIFEDMLPEKICFVAGVDVAYLEDFSIGTVTVLDYSSLEVVETKTATCKTRFPYVPTLLSFREIPPTILSIKKLHMQPDVFLVDAHGFAHPYRCGFASHLGLVIGKPTIGIAKSRLFGEAQNMMGDEDVALLKYGSEVIGAVFQRKAGSKLVYISVGHMISLETAIRIVRHCTRNSRIPEPILKAHQIATAQKRKVNNTLTINK